MATLSGLLGCVNGVDTVRNWKVSTSAALAKYVASNTKGMTGQLGGNKDWSGSYSAYGHTPTYMPGDAISFSGSCDKTKGCQGTAIIDSVEITVNIESGDIISHVVNFSGNGALTIGGSAAVSDTAVPATFSSIGCKIQTASYAAVPSYAELTNVKSYTIKFSSANVAYVDASTAGIVKRLPGVKSVALSIAVNGETSALSNIASILNTELFFRCFVTATTYWELKAMRIESISDLVIDTEAAAIVAATLNAVFTSHYVGAVGALTEGAILRPAGTTWWPAT